MHITVRCEKDMPEDKQKERLERLYSGFSRYTTNNPLPHKGEPQLLIELFPSAQPYTKEGEFRGFFDKPCDDAYTTWWNLGIESVMMALRAEDVNRGVIFFSNDHESTRMISSISEAA
jgi:hypothetical protein